MDNTYTIETLNKASSTRKTVKTFFVPKINGKRISKTNYSRKWEAVNLINSIRAAYTEAEIAEKMAAVN